VSVLAVILFCALGAPCEDFEHHYLDRKVIEVTSAAQCPLAGQAAVAGFTPEDRTRAVVVKIICRRRDG
jgi:hypothetical protein